MKKILLLSMLVGHLAYAGAQGGEQNQSQQCQKQHQQDNCTEQQNYGEEKVIGIGVVLQKKNERILEVIGIVANSPAAKTEGLRVGDYVLAIHAKPDSEWVDTHDLNLEQAVALIRGEEGVEVGLRLYNPKDHTTGEIHLIRTEIETGDALVEE